MGRGQLIALAHDASVVGKFAFLAETNVPSFST